VEQVAEQHVSMTPVEEASESEWLASHLRVPAKTASEVFQHDGLQWSTLMRMQRYLIANLLIWTPASTALIVMQFGQGGLLAAYVSTLVFLPCDICSADCYGRYWSHCRRRVLAQHLDHTHNQYLLITMLS
jgi:hypothetical protein